LTSFPTAEEDPDPFVSQGAHGGMMAFTAGPLGLIKVRSPSTEADGVAGKLVEGLTQKFGTGPAEMNVFFGFATLFSDRSDPEIGFGFQAVLETIPVGAESSQ
jgi:hypothetical protein